MPWRHQQKTSQGHYGGVVPETSHWCGLDLVQTCSVCVSFQKCFLFHLVWLNLQEALSCWTIGQVLSILLTRSLERYSWRWLWTSLVPMSWHHCLLRQSLGVTVCHWGRWSEGDGMRRLWTMTVKDHVDMWWNMISLIACNHWDCIGQFACSPEDPNLKMAVWHPEKYRIWGFNIRKQQTAFVHGIRSSGQILYDIIVSIGCSILHARSCKCFPTLQQILSFCSKILLFLISFKYGTGPSHASEATPMIGDFDWDVETQPNLNPSRPSWWHSHESHATSLEPDVMQTAANVSKHKEYMLSSMTANICKHHFLSCEVPHCLLVVPSPFRNHICTGHLESWKKTTHQSILIPPVECRARVSNVMRASSADTCASDLLAET